jgi:hypothetical protein
MSAPACFALVDRAINAGDADVTHDPACLP